MRKVAIAVVVLLSMVGIVTSQKKDYCDDFPLIVYGETVTGTIDNKNFAYGYCFSGNAGDMITITMSALDGDLDSLVTLISPTLDSTYATNNNIANSLDSQIIFVLPDSDTYLIGATRAAGGEHPSTGQFQLTLAQASNEEVSHQQAEASRKQVDELNRQGASAYHKGRYEEALVYYAEALALARDSHNTAGEANILNNMGNAYAQLGQYDQALDIYDQALTVAQQIDHLESKGIALQGIATVHYNQGRYTEALDIYTQARTIFHDINDAVNEANTLTSMSAVYGQTGQYPLALDLLQQSLTIFSAEGNRYGKAAALLNMGTLYSHLGQYPQSLAAFQEALVIFRAIDNPAGEAATLTSQGRLYVDLKQYAEALKIYLEALEIQQEIGNRVAETITLNNIGMVFLAVDDYESALVFLNQSLSSAQEIGNRSTEATSLLNLGLVYASQQEYDLAGESYDRSLNLQQEIGNQAQETMTLVYRARLAERTGSLENAIADYRAAIQSGEQVVNAAALDNAITNLSQQFEYDFPYQRLSVLLASPETLTESLSFAERGRNVLARTELTMQPIDFRASVDSAILAREAELQQALLNTQGYLDSLNKNIDASSADKQAAQSALDAAQRAYEDHLAMMQLQGGFLARQIARETIPLHEIQAVLPEDTALLIYSMSSEIRAEYAARSTSIVFILTANKLDAVFLDVTDEQIKEQVTAFAADRQTNTRNLEELFTLVFAPVAEKVAATGATRLIIAADGSLNYVPFAALTNPDTGSYLVDDYALSMIPSGTVLALLDERQSAPSTKPILAVAQPSAPGLPRLLNAASEANTIAAQFGVEAITNATEADLRANAAGSDILHISAHAEFHPFIPLYSIIHLREGDNYDGRLEVREIYELDLSATELVILSGCETGSGGDGEDLGILNQAFFGAGAQKVVSSLWSVDDEATALLLTQFMQERAKVNNDAVALQVAMQTVRETYPEPYYWASFVLTGLP